MNWKTQPIGDNMQNLAEIGRHLIHPFTCGGHDSEYEGGRPFHHSLSISQKVAVFALTFFTFLATSSGILMLGCFYVSSAVMKTRVCDENRAFSEDRPPPCVPAPEVPEQQDSHPVPAREIHQEEESGTLPSSLLMGLGGLFLGGLLTGSGTTENRHYRARHAHSGVRHGHGLAQFPRRGGDEKWARRKACVRLQDRV